MNERSHEPVLLREMHEGVATLRLNRPRQYNALSGALLESLHAELDSIARDEKVRVVLLTGNGSAFCSGHDLKEMRALASREEIEALFSSCSGVMQKLVALPQPVIAVVNGLATAAGCQLVASCDLAVASRSARFATPGVNIGLFCSTPMVALSRNIPRKAAMEMLLTGEMIDAEQAERIGLVNRVVAAGEARDQALALAQKIAAKSGTVLKLGKEAFYRQLEMDLADAYAYTAEVMVENMLARDAEEGIGAFIDKREPRWDN